jgi:hypothetical protein
VEAESDQPAAKEPQVGLWERESTQACCARHKVEPLFSALEGYDAWFTALRRDQAASRANLKEVEPFQLPNSTISRVAPIAGWHARGRLEVREGPRHPAAAALRTGLHEHRLRAVHVAADRSEQPALRPMGRREARVRHSHSSQIRTRPGLQNRDRW